MTGAVHAKAETRLRSCRRLQAFYEAVNLEMLYNAEGRTVDVTIQPAGSGSE